MIATTRPFDPEKSEKWLPLLACRLVISAAYRAFSRDFAFCPDAAVNAVSQQLSLVIEITEGRQVDFLPFVDDAISDPIELRNNIGFLLGVDQGGLPIPSAPIFAELIDHLVFITRRRLDFLAQLARGFFPSDAPAEPRDLFDEYSKQENELMAQSAFEICRIIGVEGFLELRN
jgi:hypothetical protein